MPYAARTHVPVAQSRNEIQVLLERHNADGIMFGTRGDRAVIGFSMMERVLRFEVTLPPREHARRNRQRWRALVLAIKAKLESVESGIETFDEAFLAHVVVPGSGHTVGDDVIPRLEKLNETRGIPALPGW